MPATNSPEWAWDSAEQRCYEFLQTALGTIPDVEGYRADFPRLANAVSDLNQWAFAISGGSNLHIPEPSARAGVTSWHNEALFRGRYTDRQKALQTIGLLRASLPAGESQPAGDLLPAIQGVDKLYIAAHPTVERGVVEVESDLAAGGMIRVWDVSIPMAVAYQNQDQIT